MFVRFLTEEQIEICVNMLAPFNPRVEHEDDNFLRIYAPDGDVVFSVLYTQGKRHLCRLHPEVFNPEGSNDDPTDQEGRQDL